MRQLMFAYFNLVSEFKTFREMFTLVKTENN